MIEAGPFAAIRAQGQDEERAAIVAFLHWMREANPEFHTAAKAALQVAAESIEMGTHHIQPTPIETPGATAEGRK